MTITFTLAGGPTAVLKIHGPHILMDPSFDEPQTFTGPGTEGTDGITKTTATAIRPDQIGSIDLALVSHDHHIDNLDVSGRESEERATGADNSSGGGPARPGRHRGGRHGGV